MRNIELLQKVHDHKHNKNVLDNLNESANMLTFRGKIVVNNNEYVFKTLPRKKAPKDTIYTSGEGGTLPWQK